MPSERLRHTLTEHRGLTHGKPHLAKEGEEAFSFFFVLFLQIVHGRQPPDCGGSGRKHGCIPASPPLSLRGPSYHELSSDVIKFLNLSI